MRVFSPLLYQLSYLAPALLNLLHPAEISTEFVTAVLTLAGTCVETFGRMAGIPRARRRPESALFNRQRADSSSTYSMYNAVE